MEVGWYLFVCEPILGFCLRLCVNERDLNQAVGWVNVVIFEVILDVIVKKIEFLNRFQVLTYSNRCGCEIGGF